MGGSGNQSTLCNSCTPADNSKATTAPSRVGAVNHDQCPVKLNWCKALGKDAE